MRPGWKTMTLDEACFVDYGTRVVRKKDGGAIYPVYGGGGATFRMDTYNREDCLVVARFAMSQTCTRFVQGRFFLNDSGLTLRAKDKDLSQPFLDWIIVSKNDLIYSFGKGSAQKNLDMEDFRKMEVSFPTSLPEQQRIVDILDAEFARIDELLNNAEKSLQNAMDLFHAALKSELDPQNGWNDSLLSDAVKIINGRAYSKEELLSSGKYRVLRVGNFFTNDSWYYSDLELDVDKYCEAGDLLYAWSASFGPKIWDGEKVIYHYHIWKMIPSSSIYKQFLFYWLQSYQLTSQVMSKLHGTTMAHITKGIMEATHIKYPSKAEQQRIANSLNELSTKCNTLESNYAKTLTLCDDLKQALLRKAFKGEL